MDSIRLVAYKEDAESAWRKSQGDLSRGQAYMRTLGEWDIELWRKINNTNLDPFYNNENIDQFFSFVEENFSVFPPEGTQ